MAEKLTNKLLIEAIADADAVRKTAIENAKLSLEETFTPHIKSMLSRKLRAEAEGMEKEDEADVEKTEASEEEKEAPEAKEKEVKTETAKEGAQEKAEAEHSAQTPQASSEIGAGDNKEPSAEAEATSDIDQGGEGHQDSETDWYDDWSDSDFDLDEVIAELEEELVEMGGESEEEEDEKSEPTPEPEKMDGGMKKTDAMVKHDAEETKEVVDTHSPADVSKYVEPTMEMQHDEEESLNLEEILAELEAADRAEADKYNRMAAEMASVKAELAEYKEAFKMMKGRMDEVNLLNAKLLYTNKMFRKEGLTTEQKVSIVENFDRASTVREVKMVYAVLVETLTTAAKTIKATKSPKKVVTEGFASKAIPSTAPKTESTEILEENTVAKRLQQLAGII